MRFRFATRVLALTSFVAVLAPVVACDLSKLKGGADAGPGVAASDAAAAPAVDPTAPTTPVATAAPIGTTTAVNPTPVVKPSLIDSGKVDASLPVPDGGPVAFDAGAIDASKIPVPTPTLTIPVIPGFDAGGFKPPPFDAGGFKPPWVK